MPIMFKDGKILFVGGQIAMDPACCCGTPCPGCASGSRTPAQFTVTLAGLSICTCQKLGGAYGYDHLLVDPNGTYTLTQTAACQWEFSDRSAGRVKSGIFDDSSCNTLSIYGESEAFEIIAQAIYAGDQHRLSLEARCKYDAGYIRRVFRATAAVTGAVCDVEYIYTNSAACGIDVAYGGTATLTPV